LLAVQAAFCNLTFQSSAGTGTWPSPFTAIYDEFIARASAAYAGIAAKRMATADEIAQVIYGVATDGRTGCVTFAAKTPATASEPDAK